MSIKMIYARICNFLKIDKMLKIYNVNSFKNYKVVKEKIDNNTGDEEIKKVILELERKKINPYSILFLVLLCQTIMVTIGLILFEYSFYLNMVFLIAYILLDFVILIRGQTDLLKSTVLIIMLFFNILSLIMLVFSLNGADIKLAQGITNINDVTIHVKPFIIEVNGSNDYFVEIPNLVFIPTLICFLFSIFCFVVGYKNKVEAKRLKNSYSLSLLIAISYFIASLFMLLNDAFLIIDLSTILGIILLVLAIYLLINIKSSNLIDLFSIIMLGIGLFENIKLMPATQGPYTHEIEYVFPVFYKIIDIKDGVIVHDYYVPTIYLLLAFINLFMVCLFYLKRKKEIDLLK